MMPSVSFVCLNPFPNKPWFLCVCSTSLLKTLWEKKKLLIMSNFSFSLSVFYPFGELSDIFIKLCRLQPLLVKKILKFIVWERVNMPRATLVLVHSLQIKIGLYRLCSLILENTILFVEDNNG